MMDDKLKNILSELNKNAEADEGKLMDYLNKHLSTEEQLELEMQMTDDEFMSDAMDGLQEMSDSAEVPDIVHQLNAGLKRQLNKNKKKKRREYFKDGTWIYFSIVLLLILAVVAFVVIKKIVGA